MGNKARGKVFQNGGSTLVGIGNVPVPETITPAVPDDFDLPPAADTSTRAAQERNFRAFAKIKGYQVVASEGKLGIGPKDPKGPILEQAMRAAAILNGGEAQDKPQFDLGGNEELAAEFARMVGEDPEVKVKKDKTREWLQKHFWAESTLPMLTREIARGVFKYHFTRVVGSWEEADGVLKFLVGEGFLSNSPTASGHLMFGTSPYNVTGKACFGPPELAEVQGWLNGLRAKADECRRAEFRDAGEKLAEQNTLSPAELLDGRPGKYWFGAIAPAQMYKQGEEGPIALSRKVPIREGDKTKMTGTVPVMEEKPLMCPGGSLLIEIRGNNILLLGSARDKIQELVNEVKKWEIVIPLDSILETLEEPAAGPPQAHRLKRKVEKDEFGTYIKSFNTAWNMVRNGFRAVLAQETEKNLVEDEQRRLDEEAEGEKVSAEEAILELKAGEFVMDLDWTPEQGIRIPHLIFRAAITEVDGAKFIGLKDLGANVPKEFLGALVGQEWEIGEKFGGVAQPFRAVLQGCWGFLQKQKAKKTPDTGTTTK